MGPVTSLQLHKRACVCSFPPRFLSTTVPPCQSVLNPISINMKSSMQAAVGVPSKKEPLPVELTIAAAWWASRTGDLSPEQASLFRDNLSTKLFDKYRGHWCVENPLRGNAYRYVASH
jgi:hypothetical protein